MTTLQLLVLVAIVGYIVGLLLQIGLGIPLLLTVPICFIVGFVSGRLHDRR